MEWSIRGLLNPVISRLLIYGVNAIDVEYVVSTVENTIHLNARSLETAWTREWEKKARQYLDLSDTALSKNRWTTAGELYMLSAQCYYAIFLINLASLEGKKKVYTQFADLYAKSLRCFNFHFEKIELTFGKQDKIITGYLHHPPKTSPDCNLCAIIFSGLGSCKEEMHMLASPLLERGVTVFIPDMPGNGESLISHGVSCNIEDLENVFKLIPDELTKRPELLGMKFGSYGLCMGGGYAFRAACIDHRYTFCVTLFPLLITRVKDGSTPQWMKQSEWAKYQMGHIPPETFLTEMQKLEEGTTNCPLLFIHGEHDNWMPLESALEFYSRAEGHKEKLIIQTEPVFSNNQAVTHTMPVGEQLHWIRHVAADWIASRTGPGGESTQ